MNDIGQPAKTDSPAVSAAGSQRPQWWLIPWDVAGRIGLLFTALCLVKLVMLAGFRKHLFEIHWRTDTVMPHGWLNQAAFLIFALLVALHLWRLGNRCAAVGLRTVRAANACVLVLGAAFVFLAFSVADKNFLWALVNGSQTGRDLTPSFFLQPPLWSVWLLIYALFYFVLVRLGCEYLVLRVTAVMAALYTVLFLQDMIDCRDALLVADCLGVACLLAGMRSRGSLGWFWQVQPWAWVAFLYLIFQSQADHLKQLPPERLVPASCGLVLLAGMSAFAWRRKFLPAWSWLLPFAFAAFLLLINVNYDFARNDLNLLCLGLMLPHYFLGELVLAAVLLAVAMAYRRLLPAASLWWLDGINLLLITLALVDMRLTQIMGVRLDFQVIKFGADAAMVWRQARPYLPGLVAGLILLAGLYAILVGLWQRAEAPRKILRVGSGGRFGLVSLLLLGLAGSWFAEHDLAEGESTVLLAGSSPWFFSFHRPANPVLDEKTFAETARRLGLESMLARTAATPSHPARELNVVLIFQESSYNQYLSLFGGRENTQPLLSKYRDRMELFPNFFSSFPGSMNARFATLAGLYPVRDYEALTFRRVDVKSIFEVLHEQGYASSVFYSASFDYTGFRDFLRGRGIDAMFDADTMPGRSDEPPVAWGVHEGVTLKAIQSQIKQYAASRRKFFLSYIPAAPHYPYDGTPREFRKFPVPKLDDYVPQYQNELLYLDWVIASIVDDLKNAGLLDHTLVIITNDHGEMLGENGGPIGHGWVVRPELANIPLIVMDPDHPGYRLNNTVGSQVDLLPTILDLLGIPQPQDQLYQGASLYSALAQGDRKIFLNSFQQYATVEGHRFLRGNRETEKSAAASHSSFRVYSFTNDGARTVFSEMDSTNSALPAISPFDRFQENLLEHYAHYCRAIRSLPPVAK